ncbi:uncharacterized protein LOC127728452 isoform X2 [Mytilus californianus]|uniref:uncharacterized protein LOC127728452 isoform X2 n=1 Tax=Mytilus californianus TaxID=6549 RepID=UPI002246D437|nr:uncharacterized protein LOC127728452 isoform X2 [Mytilus californianus]
MSKCQECETEFKTERKLAIHNCSAVEPEIEKCKCNECGKTFQTGKGLKIHITKVHGKPSCKRASNSKTTESTIEQEIKYDKQLPCQTLDKNQDHDDCNSIISKEIVPDMQDEATSSLKSSDNQADTEKAVFNCDQCKGSFKSNRGLKQHVSKSHKVSTENAHDSPVLPTDADKSDTCNAGLGKKEKSLTDEDEFQNVDIVEASANEGEESVLDNSVQNAVFNCNQCEKSFKTNRGLKQHVSKSHKVPTKNAHDSPVLPLHADKSGNAGLGKKEKSLTNEDEFQNVDIVEASANEVEESVLDNSYKEDGVRCNHCWRSFNTERGLKQHISKSHKASMKNAHNQVVDPVENCTDHVDHGKIEKSSIEEAEYLNVDTVKKKADDDKVTSLMLSVARNSTDTSLDLQVNENDIFKCNQCERSFKTKIGLAQHVSKSHKVSTENICKDSEEAHANESGNIEHRKIEVTSTEEEEHRNVDTVKGLPNNNEKSVLYDNQSELSSTNICESATILAFEENIKNTDTSAELQESKSPYSTEEEESDDDYEDAVLPEEVLESNEETNSESLKEIVQRDTRTVTPRTRRLVDKLIKENSLTKSITSVAVTETKKLVDTFFEQLRELSPTLKWQRFNSGSYYDKTKNDQADEFDIMIYPAKIQVEVNFDSPITGFYKVKFESPRVDENFKNLETNGYIHPAKFKEYVFGLFDKVFQSTDHHIFRRVTKKERSDNSSPAYTIIYKGIPGNPIDIDLVPCFRVNTWPCIARKIDPTWIHSKLGSVVNDAIQCHDVVSKTCPDDVEDRDLFWRLSFSYTEKKLINSANSVDKFSTKKTVFRLIKSLIQELKDNNPEIMKKFCSYHIKQFMFKQYDDWGEIYDVAKILRNVLQKLLDQLSVSPPFIDNYFIENDNVIRYVPQPEIALVVKFLREKMKEL